MLHMGGMADATPCVIGFSWRVLLVKERTPKGIYLLHPSVVNRDRDLLTHSPPFPAGGLSGASIAPLFLSLSTSYSLDRSPPSPRSILILPDGNDQVSVVYVTVFQFRLSQLCADDSCMRGRWRTLTTDFTLFIAIPGGTAVPHWAYLNVTTTDTWDQSAAEAVVSQSSAYFFSSEVSIYQPSSWQARRNPLLQSHLYQPCRRG